MRFVLGSAALLVPCFWQSRIQAGDLSSHIYNAWLATLIEKGRAPGLYIAVQWTNVLFDRMLVALLEITGPAWAQRIAVSAAVLVFAWGAFAFLSTAGGRPAWGLFPLVAMLAYGWVFYMGLFNFYLSMGLCLWGLALSWKPSAWRLALAGVLLALAWLAHALPVLWAVPAGVYLFAARRMSLRARLWLTLSCALALVLVHFYLAAHFLCRWVAPFAITGADQAWVYGRFFLFFSAALLAIWGWLALRLADHEGPSRFVSSPAVQLTILCSLGVALLPDAIRFPQFAHVLAYITPRMSLAVALCACLALARLPLRRGEIAFMAALALAYFAAIYTEAARLNRIEDQLDALVATLPPSSRVVAPLEDPQSRVNSMEHLVDRACIARCFSWANYEPSSTAFRVRVVSGNPYVMTSVEQWRTIERTRQPAMFGIGRRGENLFLTAEIPDAIE